MIRNLLYICRSLGRTWKFSTVVVLTLALGLGANAAVLIFANTLLFHPLPYADSDRVVNLWSSSSGQPEPAMTVSPPDFQDWQKRSTSFEGLAAFNVSSGDLVGHESPENVAGAVVTPNFFNVIGIQPMIGRGFDSGDDHQPVIVLSYSLWQRDFGGSKSVIGDKLALGDKPYTVIGVMPPGFIHPEPLWDRTAEFWRPMPDYSAMQRGFRFLRAIGRLKPTVSLGAAASEMNEINSQLAREFPQAGGRRTVLLVPLRQQMFGDMYRPLLLLFFVAGAVLLVAWANVTNLQLARINSRLPQIQIRLAMGARRRQLVFLVFGESLVLTVAGTALGLLLGYLALRALRLVAPSNLRGLELMAIDGRLLLFILALATISCIFTGLPSVWRLGRLSARSAGMQGSTYQGMKTSKHRAQSLIMAIQIALVLPLLIATSILARSFMNLVRVDPGFSGDHMLTLRINLPQSRYPDAEAARNFFKEFMAAVKTVPAVQQVAITSSIPLTETNTQMAAGLSLQQSAPADETKTALYRGVSEDYFQTMGIPLQSGRQFNTTDIESAPAVAIINTTLMHENFPNQDPLGKSVFISRGAAPVSATVVGVVGDIRSQSLASPPAAEIYMPFAQDASLPMAVVVRTYGDPTGIIGSLRNKLAILDKQLTLRETQSMEQILYARTSFSRFAMLLMTFSSFLTLALTLIGVGGIVAYIVSERTKEFGIRLAIGATHADIIKGLLLHILKFAALGTVVGITLAASVKRIPANLVYGVKTDDLLAFAGSGLVLILTVLLASYLPVRNILQIDTTDLLRTER